jgi:hypothetical protein
VERSLPSLRVDSSAARSVADRGSSISSHLPNIRYTSKTDSAVLPQDPRGKCEVAHTKFGTAPTLPVGSGCCRSRTSAVGPFTMSTADRPNSSTLSANKKIRGHCYPPEERHLIGLKEEAFRKIASMRLRRARGTVSEHQWLKGRGRGQEGSDVGERPRLAAEMPRTHPPDAARPSERSRLSAGSLLRVLRVRDRCHLPMAAIAHRPQTHPTVARLIHRCPGGGRHGPRRFPLTCQLRSRAVTRMPSTSIGCGAQQQSSMSRSA